MSFTEPERHRLHRVLEQSLGLDEANTLMAHLPPFAWTDIATKADLAVLRHDLTREFDTRLETTEHRLRTEIADLRTEVRTGMADLRTEVRTGMADLRTDLHKGAFVVVGGLGTLMALLAAASNLFG